MRLKLVAAIALAGAPFAAQAADFNADGQTYHYVATRQANGNVRLTGNVAQGGAFDLTVHDRRVAGNMEGAPVDFIVSKETVAALNAELASSQGVTATN